MGTAAPTCSSPAVRPFQSFNRWHYVSRSHDRLAPQSNPYRMRPNIQGTVRDEKRYRPSLIHTNDATEGRTDRRRNFFSLSTSMHGTSRSDQIRSDQIRYQCPPSQQQQSNGTERDGVAPNRSRWG